MHRYHGPAFACSRPAACRWAMGDGPPPCYHACATVPQKAHARGLGLPAAPTAPCAPNSLTSSRSGGRYSCGGLVLPGPSNALHKYRMQRWPFLAHRHRRRQHRDKTRTHSAVLYRHFAPDLPCKTFVYDVVYAQLSLCLQPQTHDGLVPVVIV